MELKELRKKSISELNKIIAQQREKLRASRFSVSAKQLKNIRTVREIKKSIAQILTVMNKKRKEDISIKQSDKILSESPIIENNK